MDAAQQNAENDRYMNQTTTRALMDYLERQLGDRAKIIKYHLILYKNLTIYLNKSISNNFRLFVLFEGFCCGFFCLTLCFF